MQIKIIPILLVLFFTLIQTTSAKGKKIQYYQNRIQDIYTFKWKFINSIPLKKVKKLKNYYAVYYNSKNHIIKVKFPYYSRSHSGRILMGKSIEYYTPDQKLKQRKSYIRRKLISIVNFKYNSKGNLLREEYYKNKKLQFLFVYSYKGNQLLKRAHYNGEDREPIGTWLYFNAKRQVIKREKYELNDESKGKLLLTTQLNYNNSGILKSEKNYSDKKPFGYWYFYNDQGRLSKTEQYLDGALLRYYIYTYASKGKVEKIELFENNALVETIRYDKKGKIIKQKAPKK